MLDATVFKYVAGMPNALKSVIGAAQKGKSVSEPLFKSALAQASKNALKRGAAEGIQESIGDGMTLDIMAKNLYDDDRKFITGDALGRRVMEFTVGGLVGGIASGIGDSGRILQGKEITAEGQQRLEDERDRILEVMPSVDREKIARAILDGDPEPEITVFDINGEMQISPDCWSPVWSIMDFTRDNSNAVIRARKLAWKGDADKKTKDPYNAYDYGKFRQDQKDFISVRNIDFSFKYEWQGEGDWGE